MDTVQPSPGLEVNWTLPPTASALRRMPGIPLPPFDPEGFSVGLSPLPLSVTVSRISRSTTLSSAFTALQPKWRAALWMHSLKIRKRWRRASRLGF